MSILYNGKEYRVKKNKKGFLKLNLSGKEITEISEIKGLETQTDLNALILNNNNITEIKGLETLKNLIRLELRDNQITEIKGLENLANLEVLSLENNNIENIKWEIPKGHKNIYDIKDIRCAIRELLEETNIDIRDLNVHKKYKKIEKIKFSNIVYKISYFLGKYKDVYTIDDINEFVSVVNRKNDNEILCHKWFTYHEIKNLNIDSTKKKYINTYFKIIKKNNL